MTEYDSNPHLLEYASGSWEPPFRKWILGALIPLGLAIFGLSATLSKSALIPLPTRGRPGLIWLQAEGLMAVSWGITLLSVALILHGRYLWRYRLTGWQHYESIQNAGALVAVLAFASTTVQIIVQLLR